MMKPRPSFGLGLTLALLGGAGASPGTVLAGDSLGPVIEWATGGHCVEPPEVMRRFHMDYLKHQRDDTLQRGIRGAKYSLKACVECHASRTSNSVTAAPTNFCISCHSYAAVKIDCFQCHATQPRSLQQASTAPSAPANRPLASTTRRPSPTIPSVNATQ